MNLVVFLNCLLLVVGVRGVVLKQPAEENDSTSNRPLIVIDNDGGIDDCLAMLLVLTNQDMAKLLAVTCVFGDTDVDNACNNALRVLALADKQGQIPVHKGSSGSISTGKYVPDSRLISFIGVDGLGNRSHEFPTGDQQLSGTTAALALIQLARTHPSLITVLAIGPLTNLALAHRIDPEFTHLLKGIVIMGGSYNGIVTDRAEFNFKEDSLAANIILTEAACLLTIVPHETTTKSAIPWDKYQELIKTDTRLGHFLQRVSQVESAREYDTWGGKYVVYDFVAAAVVLRPEIVTTEVKKKLSVEYEGGLTKGVMVVLDGQKKRTPARIVTGVDGTAIYELLRRMIVSS